MNNLGFILKKYNLKLGLHSTILSTVTRCKHQLKV